MIDQPKLIIIRGNSGSGKSTSAELIRDRAKTDTALINQDYIRRTLLRDKSTDHARTCAVIDRMVIACLSQGFNVILEGVLSAKRYSYVLKSLVETYPSYVYYFDVSIDETLKRHQTKPIASEVSEEKIREWYMKDDLLGVKGEKTITEESEIEQTVQFILKDSGL